MLIGSPFAVLEAESGNIMTNEECVLLRIPERVIELSDFYKIKADKASIISKAKLAGSRGCNHEALLSVNSALHHTFKVRKLAFRAWIEVTSLGIIIEGSATVRVHRGQKKL